MTIKNIHEKLSLSIKTMLIDMKVNLPFYGSFCLHMNFKEQDTIGTCGVNMTAQGMNFYYSPTFLGKLSQKEVNFVTLHEEFHLLFSHPKRTILGQYNHKMANIAQDMIINHIIWQDISHDFIEIPKGDDGKNMALFVPKEYDGPLIFEALYEWLRDEKEKWDNNKSENGQCQSCEGTGQSEDGGKCPDCNGTGNQDGKDSTGKPSYGPYGKNPKNEESNQGSGKDDNNMDTWSKEQIFQDMENGTGEYLDKHIGDEIPKELRDSIVRDTIENIKSRGISAGNLEETLQKLRKKRKDYLSEIKRAVSNIVFGTVKQKTIIKPNRRQISGIKGKRKTKNKINVILDVSGSMCNEFEKVLSYIYKNNVEVNMIQADTQVTAVDKIKNTKKIESLKIKGLGGTTLMPAIDYVVENCNQYNTAILTDGYTDTLYLDKLKGKVLILTTGCECPIASGKDKVKQIVIDTSYN